MLSGSFDQRDISPSEDYMELSWEMFGELCRALALKVAASYDPEIVIGVARAGVIPGAVIASILRRDFFSLKITRREGGQVVRQRPSILSAAPRQARGKRRGAKQNQADQQENMTRHVGAPAPAPGAMRAIAANAVSSQQKKHSHY